MLTAIAKLVQVVTNTLAAFDGINKLVLANKKIVVVMPAYNSAATLQRTYEELPLDIVDEVIVVDDLSEARCWRR